MGIVIIVMVVVVVVVGVELAMRMMMKMKILSPCDKKMVEIIIMKMEKIIKMALLVILEIIYY